MVTPNRPRGPAALADALVSAKTALDQGHAAQAEQLARKVVDKDPRNAAAQQILGGALLLQGRHAEAIAPLEAAARTLRDPALDTQLAIALREAGRTDDALSRLKRAVKREPPYVFAFHELGFLLYSLGRYAEGWEEYRWRLIAQGMTATAPEAHVPRLPASLKGRRIELVGEQGLGDILFFLRFAALPVERDLDDGVEPVAEHFGQAAGVQQGDVAFDQAGVFESLHPPQAGRRRDVHALGQCLVGQRSVVLEQVQQLAVYVVKFHWM